ncbi:MAG: hypothetical protein M3Y28_04855 [Armatimonadota bacterium]|nr:hypothetical protein [Armatimonadota bacterium]
MQAITIPELVRRLLTVEDTEGREPDSVIGVAEGISDTLRAHLSKRIGQEGFRTLQARALTLTTALYPHLRAVRVAHDGSLIGLRGATGTDSPEPGDAVTPQERAEGVIALLGQLIGLLITLIGEDLTLRILSAVSPELVFQDTTGREADNL